LLCRKISEKAQEKTYASYLPEIASDISSIENHVTKEATATFLDEHALMKSVRLTVQVDDHILNASSLSGRPVDSYSPGVGRDQSCVDDQVANLAPEDISCSGRETSGTVWVAIDQTDAADGICESGQGFDCRQAIGVSGYISAIIPQACTYQGIAYPISWV
jgi:hypothetical protein